MVVRKMTITTTRTLRTISCREGPVDNADNYDADGGGGDDDNGDVLLLPLQGLLASDL